MRLPSSAPTFCIPAPARQFLFKLHLPGVSVPAPQAVFRPQPLSHHLCFSSSLMIFITAPDPRSSFLAQPPGLCSGSSSVWVQRQPGGLLQPSGRCSQPSLSPGQWFSSSSVMLQLQPQDLDFLTAELDVLEGLLQPRQVCDSLPHGLYFSPRVFFFPPAPQFWVQLCRSSAPAPAPRSPQWSSSSASPCCLQVEAAPNCHLELL